MIIKSGVRIDATIAEAVLKAVNLRDDTDTVVAVAGGLANLYYGMEAIPEDWLDAVQQKDLIDGILVKVYQGYMDYLKFILRL